MQNSELLDTVSDAFAEKSRESVRRNSVWVNGNWRLTFEFRDGHAYVLDYEDNH